MCEYCEKEIKYDKYRAICGYDVENLSTRQSSFYNEGSYVGIQAAIDADENKLVIYACLDNKNIKPISDELRIPINYCPKCGRKLDKYVN